jgi:predicted NACHT family NTPase
MQKHTYNWRRFWHQRGMPINTHAGGYLQDPDNDYGYALNPNALPFTAIAEIPCLALLAEPGMGKSRTLEMERDAIDAVITAKGARSLWLDLRAYGDETRLINDLFGSAAFQEWLAGDYRLHVFLDSFDEALLRIDVLTPLLIAELGKYPVKQLSLRIACRAADWPAPLEDGLRDIWGKDAVGIFELAPLRFPDIVEAAQANGVDADAFGREVERMQAGPLATKPVTLDMLLGMYRRHGGFPHTQAELYEAGCLLLCEEENPFRRAARRVGKLSPDQRMQIAGRIAAVMVFANKYAVWMDVDRGNVPDVDVRLSELRLSGEEQAPDEDALRETLGTALFSAREPQQMGWAHQTYAEFLAAWYLRQRSMTPPQLMNLLVYTGDDSRKLVPQLHETAAWVASMVPDMFREIMRSDPEVLLRSDVATANDADRAALVTALLSLYEEGGSLERFSRPFHKLKHPGLADQLRPYLVERGRTLEARDAAVDMVYACAVDTLLPEVLALCLNPKEHLSLRIGAVTAIQAMGDEDTKAQLKPLLYTEVEHDVGLQLKGRVLQTLWPQHLTATELFTALTPSNIRFVGPYEMFLSQDFVSDIQPADLPLALEWVTSLLSRHELRTTFGKANNAIFRRAWRYLDEEAVLPAFARAAFSRLKEHEPIITSDRGKDPEVTEFNQELFANEERRRRLVMSILPLFTAESSDAVWLLYSTPLLIPQDISWLIEELLASENAETQRKLAQLIDRLYVPANTAHFDLIYDACQTNAILAETFARFLQAIPLDSPQTKEQREDYYRRLEWQEKREKRELLAPPPAERVATCLSWVENGNADAWGRLNEEMTLEADSTDYGELLKTDVRELPGWKEAELATQIRIVEAARRHILEGETHADEWLGTNQYSYSMFSSFHALCLLENEMPGFVAELSPTLWRKWMPVIYAYRSDTGQDEAIEHEMLRRAYYHAPDELIKVMLAAIEGDLKSENGLVHIPSRLKSIWDDHIAQALLNKAQDTTLAWPALGIILAELFQQRYEPARLYAETLVTTPGIEGSAEWKRAVTATRHLMFYTPDTSWPIIWPPIRANSAFGREVITAYAHTGDRYAERLKVLPERTLADFYIWLETEFPHADDPKHAIDGNGMHTITARESVAMWRDGVLRQLKQKGTQAAGIEIARLAATFPHLEWLKFTLLEAQHITRQATWTPPTPRDVLLLNPDTRHRPVQNGDELHAIVQVVLGRLAAEVQNLVRAAIDRFAPKGEKTLPGYIKHLPDTKLNNQSVMTNQTPWHTLRESMEECFSLEEVRTLCFDLDIDYDSLGGEGKSAKTRELIARFRREARISELIAYLTNARPTVPWSQLYPEVASGTLQTHTVVPVSLQEPASSLPQAQPHKGWIGRLIGTSWRNWGDHPIVVILAIIATVVSIVAGMQQIMGTLRSQPTPTASAISAQLSPGSTAIPAVSESTAIPTIAPTMVPGSLANTAAAETATAIFVVESTRAAATEVATEQAPTPTAIGGGTGRIAFTSNREGSDTIYLTDVNVGQIQRLTADPREARRPMWSPEGSKILFNMRSEAGFDIYMSNADGSSLINITKNPQPDYSRATWSPDGNHIAFGTKCGASNNEICVLRIGETQPVNITKNSGEDYDPAWSPAGNLIAFVSERGSPPAIYVMATDGSGQTRLSSGSSPVWSPDGTRIAFTSLSNGNYDIYVMNANGSNIVRLTDNPARDASPAWSPDGTKIAFVSTRDKAEGGLVCNDDAVPCKYTIYVMDTDGNNVSRVTNSEEDSRAPMWQPR